MWRLWRFWRFWPCFVLFVPKMSFLSFVVAFLSCVVSFLSCVVAFLSFVLAFLSCVVAFLSFAWRVKIPGTVLFLLRSRTVNMTKRVCRDCPIPNCGAKYLVRLSNHLTDVHGLDYINRRKWLQEVKLQPKVRVMIYPTKRTQGIIPSTSETPLSVQEEEKGTIVHHLSTPRGVKKSIKYLPRGLKKSLKSLPRGVRKAVNKIKHETTADSVAHFVWRRWRVEHREESLVTPPAVPACHTKPRPISFTFSLLVLLATLHLPLSLLSKLVLFKRKENVLERRL